MRVVGAHVHEYRGIKDLALPLGPVTVLIGPNGAGKSSVLEALGYRTIEQGALERRGDERSKVSWFLAPDDGDAVTTRHLAETLLQHTPDHPPPARYAIDHMAKRLVVRRDPQGLLSLWLDVFRLLVDVDSPKRRKISDTLGGKLAKLAGVAWADDLRGLLDQPAEALPPFRSLRVDLADLDLDLVTPTPISMTAAADDISPVLLDRISEICHAAFQALKPSDPTVADALARLEQGLLLSADRAGMVPAALRALEERTNRCLPPFLAAVGTVKIDRETGPDDLIGEAEAKLVELADLLNKSGDLLALRLCRQASTLLRAFGDSIDAHFESRLHHTTDQKLYQYSRLGTGQRRWICGAIDEAARSLLDELTAGKITAEEASVGLDARRLPVGTEPPRTSRVRLIDDPVEGLEPRIHGEVIAWLRGLVRDGHETLVLTSHHASVLDVATVPDDLVVVGVQRRDGLTGATAFGPGRLHSFAENLAGLGITNEELFFLARGLLLVEGSDDLDVITAIYGERLAERGVFVHPIGGHTARQILNAFRQSAYRFLELPAWLMLDSTHDPALDRSLHCEHSTTDRTPSPLRQAADELTKNHIRLLHFEPHDIAMGVDLDVYRSVFRGRHRLPPNVKALRQLAQLKLGKSVKRWFCTRLLEPDDQKDQASRFSREVLQPVVEHIRQNRMGDDAASPWLRASMNRLLAELDRAPSLVTTAEPEAAVTR